MPQPTLPANVRVFEIGAAMVVSRALWVAAEFGIADHLDNEPRGVDELASVTRTHADSLYRVLRLLVTVGVFEEHAGRRFAHTEMSRTLRSDHPTRTRAAVRMLGMDGMWRGLLLPKVSSSRTCSARGERAMNVHRPEPPPGLSGDSVEGVSRHVEDAPRARRSERAAVACTRPGGTRTERKPK